jgi:autotransporter-associated beta strand protein
MKQRFGAGWELVLVLDCTRCAVLVITLFCVALLTPRTSLADTNTWDGSLSTNWTRKQNWGNNTLSSGDSIVFAGLTRTTNNNDEPTDFHIAGITFDATAGTFVLNGARIGLSGAINNFSVNTQTINLNLLLTNSSQIFNTQSGPLIINGIISGATPLLGIIKNGSQQLTLNGANTYSGGTLVNAGTLNYSTNTALGSGSVSLGNGTYLSYTGARSATVSNSISVTSGTGTIGNTGGATLTLSGGLSHSGAILQFLGGSYNVTGQISGSSANSDLLINGASVTLAGSNTYNGPTYLTNGATLNANVTGALPSTIRSALHLSSNSTFYLGASQAIASLSGAAGSAVTLGSSTLTLGSSGGLAAYAGTITGTGGVTKDGTLAQLLSGVSSFSGMTVINAGSLSLGTTGSLNATAGVLVNTGSTFLLGRGTANQVSPNASLTLNGGSLSMGAGTVRASSQEFTSLTLTANSVIDFTNLSGSSDLYFSTFSGLSSTSSLSIYHWSGEPVWGGASPGDPTRLYALLNDLNSAQLGNISFYSGSGTGFLGTGTFSTSSTSGGFSEIVPIPEPSVMIATFLLLSTMILSWRRNLE